MIELLLFTFLVLVPGFEDEFERASNETGLNYLIVQHEDLSTTLYSWDNASTTVGADGFPSKMTPLAGYANIEALSGANGVMDVLEQSKSWNLSND